MRIRLLGVAGICLASMAYTASTQAQTARGENWEATIDILYSSSESANGDHESSVDVDSAVGLGLGLAYNFNSKLAVGFEFSWVEPDYDLVLDTEDNGLVSIDHDMSVYTSQFNGVWNFIDGPLTPYVQVGLGWTYVDSNVADGPPSTGCWWDPWWGYVCYSDYDSYDDTSFSWGYGAGMRWELSRTMFVKGSVNRVEIDGGSVDITFDSARLELGWMF